MHYRKFALITIIKLFRKKLGKNTAMFEKIWQKKLFRKKLGKNTAAFEKLAKVKIIIQN